MSSENRTVLTLLLVLAGVFIGFVYLTGNVYRVQYDYTLRIVATGGAILGLVAGVTGCFAVLRQQSLLGDSLSHAALPGVCVAFLIFGRDLGFLLIGAGIAGWLAMLLINLMVDTTRLKQDTALSVTLTAFFAIGLAILTFIQGRPDASQAGLDQFIFGQAAAIVQQDVILIAVLGAVIFGTIAVFWKEFKLITFNPEFAQANGYPARALELLLSTLVVIAIVMGLQVAGVILMVGMLIAPAVAARQWTKHLGQMLILAGAVGAFSGATGAIISAIDAGLATGPLIIVVASIIVLISLAFAPERGLVWQWLKQLRDRRQFAAHTILREIHSHALLHGDPHYPTPTGYLDTLRGTGSHIGLKKLKRQNLLAESKDGWILTKDGLAQAENDILNQRLWQMYRLYGHDLQLPIIPDNPRVDIRSLLPDDAINQLELKMEGAQ